MSEAMPPSEASVWLKRIAADVREAGDVQLVRLDSDGVGPAAISLADELWLVAHCLDPDATFPAAPSDPQEQP